MSTATHVEAFDSPASEILAPPRRQTAGDPLVLGLPLIAVGAFALGLQLVGFVNVSSNGSPLAMLIGASGLGLLLSTAWAASLRFTPLSSPWAAGTSLPTTVLGSLAACTHDPKLLYPAPRRSAPRSSDSPRYSNDQRRRPVSFVDQSRRLPSRTGRLLHSWRSGRGALELLCWVDIGGRA
jgi:hypothetical protein